MEWRKHDNSSFARDVWLCDVATGKHTRLTAFGRRRPPAGVGPGPEVAVLPVREERHVQRLAARPRRPAAPGAGDDAHDPPGALPERLARRGPVLRLRRRDLGAPGRRAPRAGRLEVHGRRRPARPRGRADRRHRRGHRVRRLAGRQARSRSSPAARSSSPPPSTARRGGSPTPPSRSARSASRPTAGACSTPRSAAGAGTLYRTDLTDPDEPNFFNATALKETPVVASDRRGVPAALLARRQGGRLPRGAHHAQGR